MLNTNFIITLLTILATLFCLFQGEIKEGFLNTPFVMPPHYSGQLRGEEKPKHYQALDSSTLGNEPIDGLVNKPQVGPWTGFGPRFAPVEYKTTRNPLTKELLPHRRTKLGYDFSHSYTGKALNASAKNATCRENFVNPADKKGNSGVMVEAARNMQPMGPPPRFMVTGPKLNLYSPIDQAQYAVDNNNPIVNYGCNDVYSSSGQMLKGQCQNQNVRENYEDQVLPADMTNNTCLVGGPNVSLDGQPQQPVIVDRMMWSNIKSRYQRGGVDRFRGDLTIVPDTLKGAPGWFQTSVYPSVDLAASYITQHNKAGKENDDKAAALGIQCNMLNEGGCGNSGFGGGNAPPQGAYGRCLNVTFGTDISVDTEDGVM
jgi:hypothetical protein